MIGVNEMKLNQATVAAAVQAYLNDGVTKKDKQVVVRGVTQLGHGEEDMFAVKVEPYTPIKRVRKRRAVVAHVPVPAGAAEKTP